MASETQKPSSESAAPERAPETAGAAPSEPAAYRLPIPHGVFVMVGHVFAAAIGLGLGYLVLHWLKPGRFPLPWQ